MSRTSPAASARTGRSPVGAPHRTKPARVGQGGGAGRPPTPVPGRSNPLRNRWYQIGAAVLVAALVALLLIRPWESSTETPAALDQEIAAMQAATAASDARNVGLIGDAAIAAQEALLPLMTGLQGPLPTTDAAPVPADEEQILAWQGILETVAKDMTALPSGSSEYNIAKNSFLLSLGLLSSTLQAYSSAVAAGSGSEPDADLVSLAVDLRAQATEAWSVAGIQLDLLFNDADRGHLHVSLPILPDGTEGPDTGEDH